MGDFGAARLLSVAFIFEQRYTGPPLSLLGE
jgi:hypothetical protein